MKYQSIQPGAEVPPSYGSPEGQSPQRISREEMQIEGAEPHRIMNMDQLPDVEANIQALPEERRESRGCEKAPVKAIVLFTIWNSIAVASLLKNDGANLSRNAGIWMFGLEILFCCTALCECMRNRLQGNQ